MNESAGINHASGHGAASASPCFAGSAGFLPHQVGSWSPDWSSDLPKSPWGTHGKEAVPKLNNGSRSLINGDTSLFSSSLPVLFKNQLVMENTCGGKPPSGDGDEEFGSLEEMESQTIGKLLPDDEDELLAGIRDEIDGNVGEFEELDIFSSGGGLEMEGDHHDFFQPAAVNHGEHPFGEHPSRTLFVRNINSNVEDCELRALFEKYGDIRTMYTSCKHRGFVMIAYYDIRSARVAMRSLQGKPLRRRKLDIHFSIPKDNPSDKDINQGTLVVFNLEASVSNEDLRNIFSKYGEIKEIRETPHKRHHKFIEFYDVRHSEAALRALNRTEIAGKRIKLEPSRPGGARKSMMQQHNRELETEENYYPRGNWNNSPPGLDSRLTLDSDGPFLSPNYRSFSPRVNGSDMGIPDGQNRPLRNHLLDHQLVGQPHSLPEYNYPQVHKSSFSPNFLRHTESLSRTASLKDGYANGGSASPLWGMDIFNHGPQNSPMPWQSLSPRSGELHPKSGFSPLGSYQVQDQHRGYAGESPDLTPFIQPGSFGSFRSVNGSVNGHADHGPTSPNLGMYMPQHLFGNSLDERRGRGMFGQVENKQYYQLDLERIISGEDTRTTLMIKNIPNKYTSKMLLAAIDEYHQGTYDFVYLPIDFKNKCNVGYAFINMLSPASVIPFYKTFNGKKWEKFNSEKVASLAYARIQGKAALIAHFQNSSLMNEDKRCRPIIFHADGSNSGLAQEPFPEYGRFGKTPDDYIKDFSPLVNLNGVDAIVL